MLWYSSDAKRDAYDLPDYDQVMKLYDVIHSLIQKGAIGICLCTGCKWSGSSTF